MRDLPYKSDSFDAIVCMWSAFSELARVNDQMKAIKEMIRVLKKGGFAFLEMPESEKNGKKVTTHAINGVKAMPMFNQTKVSLEKILDKLKPDHRKVFMDDFGGRKRLLALFYK